MKALQNNLSLYKAYTYGLSNLSHLQIFGSTVYVFIYKEEQTLKPEKWSPTILKGTLVRYDGHTIYCVYLKDQKRVIRIKDLQIFEDYKNKLSTELPDYSDNTLIFQGFLFADNNNKPSEIDLDLNCVSQKIIDIKAN